MVVKRDEIITVLDGIVAQLMDLIAKLKQLPLPESHTDNTMCPIHNVPWKKYKFGWAHPPVKPGDKWCKKGN